MGILTMRSVVAIVTLLALAHVQGEVSWHMPSDGVPLSGAEAETSCNEMGLALCTYEELCPNGDNGSPQGMPAEHTDWMPFAYNGGRRWMNGWCEVHEEMYCDATCEAGGWGEASWACASWGDDCCACDASIGQTDCDWEENAECDDGYVAIPITSDDPAHSDVGYYWQYVNECSYSCYSPACAGRCVDGCSTECCDHGWCTEPGVDGCASTAVEANGYTGSCKGTYACCDTLPEAEPNGWYVYGGSCYAALGTYDQWSNAQSACEEYGGSLVSIADSDENDFVSAVCGDRVCWLGLREKSGEDCEGGNYQGTSCTNYYWVDGSGDLTWTNWYQPWGAPNNYNDWDQEYVVMNALDCCCEDSWDTTGDCCDLNGAWDDYPGDLGGWMFGAVHALCEVQNCAVDELDDVQCLDAQLTCSGSVSYCSAAPTAAPTPRPTPVPTPAPNASKATKASVSMGLIIGIAAGGALVLLLICVLLGFVVGKMKSADQPAPRSVPMAHAMAASATVEEVAMAKGVVIELQQPEAPAANKEPAVRTAYNLDDAVSATAASDSNSDSYFGMFSGGAPEPPKVANEPPAAQAPPAAAPKFDPMTGKPLSPAPRFDPMTGKPIPKFDPMTGKQNWG